MTSLRFACLSIGLALLASCAFSSPPDTAPSPTLGAASRSESPAAPAKVELKTVKYDELTAAVRAQFGKVVVTDIWASWCVPCKKEFPHLVELHEKYQKDGLVCMSVTVDEIEGQKAALKFLTEKKATFRNFRIDEPAKVWQEKWDINAVPAVFVFDRLGRRAGKFTKDDPDKQFSYEKDIAPLVAKLLKDTL